VRAFAGLSTVAITAALAVVVPGSVTENTAMASTPVCADARFYTDAVANGTAEPQERNDGTYEITSAANLVFLSENQNAGTPLWRTRSFAQTVPIDLEGCLFTPIGLPGSGLSGSYPFTGNYDGQHYPVRYLSVTRDQHAGLFGETHGALITRIALEHVDITVNGSGFDSGSLIGQANSTTVSHSYATGTISSIGFNVGGLVGAARSGTVIENSFSSVSVTRTTSGNVLGGLVGILSGSTINNSYSTGGVSGGDGNSVGGLVGQVTSTSTISHSYSRGAVTGADSVGGLIGSLANPTTLTLTNSYATGEVTGTTSNVGGLVGGKATSGVTVTVTNSFWDTTTTLRTTTLDNQGAGRTRTEMTSFATFTDTTSADLDQAWPIVEGWQSFDPNDGRVWGIRSDLNDGYPYLLWEYETIPDFPCGALVDGVYQVSTAEHLAEVGSGDTTEGAACGLGDSYKQTADIELSGVWTSLAADGFTGEFDGGEFSITGLTLDPADEPLTNQGLFALIGSAGVVTNVSLINVSLDTDSRRQRLGTLAGKNRGAITNSSATGSLRFGADPVVFNEVVIFYAGSGSIGGLVGSNEGLISGSQAQVTFSDTEARPAAASEIGGLVGDMFSGSIEDSHALGNVMGTTVIGGLAGGVFGGGITDSYATGDVTARTDSGGGLVGFVDAGVTISNSFATGEVEGFDYLGGLVGWLRGGTIHQSWATGSVTAYSGEAGGLVGVAVDDANISESWAEGMVTARWFAGGLVGYTESTAITQSHALGNVSGYEHVGGLVGGAYLQSVISRSWAEGDVSGDLFIGGLIGELGGTVQYSYATGKAEGTQEIIGGLVGGLGNVNGPGMVTNSYATGDVQGPLAVGGLVGYIDNSASTITNSYSAGLVTGTGETPREIGGLIGQVRAEDTPSITNSFWDVTTSELGSKDDTKESAGGVGKTTDQLTTISTFADAGWSIASCRTTGEDTVWGIVASDYPFLTWQETPQLASCATTPEPSSPSSQSSPSVRPRPIPDPTALEPVTPAAPQQFGGASTALIDSDAEPESTLDRPVAGDEATAADVDDAGGNPAVSDSDSETDVSGVGQTSGSSAWLWAIGLGGLGAAALIAGGMVFARMRP
jgi:hypothetical protein